ncbi:MAG: hypothetical protein OXB84_08635, partial [Halobacteriovoraceae bacterium]|nr:hypothetical protein [Halobacteriovoraceae bacterium]
LDILILALFFSMRIISGHFIGDIAISFWLFAFSIFIFLSLASLKRFTELKNLHPSLANQIPGRGYIDVDASILFLIGIISGLLSTFTIILYFNSKEIMSMYKNPIFLWSSLPILIYWILRIFLLGNRGIINEDPVKFIIKDKTSFFIALLLLGLVILAK